MNPEEIARVQMDELLEYAGWEVQDRARISLFGRLRRGVALREAPLPKLMSGEVKIKDHTFLIGESK